MMSSLPSIRTLDSQKPSKSISFKVKTSRRNSTKVRVVGESRKLPLKLTEDVSHVGIHGNTTAQEKSTKSFEEIMGHSDKNEQDKLKLSNTQKGFKSEPTMYRDAVVYSHVVQCLHDGFQTGKGINMKQSEDASIQLSKMLREKDREITRLREIIRKASLDRENATNSDAHSRMRISELKHKLSNQQRQMEHVTTVERLRCKEKVSNETERLRHERDEARVQLEHYDKLVWHLRKQVEQLGYLSRQRYKTIQELGKKMTAKDKSIQEMRKRLEQAQLIAIPGTSMAERRNSISESKNISWEAPSRLATVNEN